MPKIFSGEGQVLCTGKEKFAFSCLTSGPLRQMYNPDPKKKKKISTTATIMVLSQLVVRFDGEVCRGAVLSKLPSRVLPFGFLPEIM